MLKRSKRSPKSKASRKRHIKGLKKVHEYKNRCQAIKEDKKQCTREAKIKLDLTEGKSLFGYKIVPAMKCCFFCTQHAAIYAGYAAHQIGMNLATSKMSWDEYISINPDYAVEKLGL